MLNLIKKKGFKWFLPIFLLVVLSTSVSAFWFEPETPPGLTAPFMDSRYCLANGTPCVNYTLIANITNGTMNTYNNISTHNLSAGGSPGDEIVINDGFGNFVKMNFKNFAGNFNVAMIEGFSLNGLLNAPLLAIANGLYIVDNGYGDITLTFYNSAFSDFGTMRWDEVTDSFFFEDIKHTTIDSPVTIKGGLGMDDNDIMNVTNINVSGSVNASEINAEEIYVGTGLDFLHFYDDTINSSTGIIEFERDVIQLFAPTVQGYFEELITRGGSVEAQTDKGHYYLSTSDGFDIAMINASRTTLFDSILNFFLLDDDGSGWVNPLRLFSNGNINMTDGGDFSTDGNIYGNCFQAGGDSSLVCNLSALNQSGDLDNYWKANDDTETRDFITTGNVTASNLSVGQFNADNGIVVNNLSVGGYYSGQPIDGGIGGGLIWADEITEAGLLNVTLSKCFGAVRNCSYPSHLIRVHLQNNTIIYCNMSRSDFTVPDNQDSTMLVGKECSLSFVDVNLVIGGTQTGERTVIGRAMAHGGEIEIISGAEMMPTEIPALRFETFLVDNLKIINGGLIDDTLDDFPNYTMSAGRYIFANTPVFFSKQNTTDDEVELVYHTAGTWATTELYMGMNLTHCDDGTDLIDCSDNKIRPRLVFFTGHIQNGDDTTEFHQLAPLDSLSYSTVAACEEAVIAGEVSFTLPDFYNYNAVKIYVYCARTADTSWAGAWIDLRRGGTITGGGSPDLSPYLTRDGQRTLTGDWNTGGYGIRTGGNLSSVGNLGTDSNLTVGQDAKIEGNVTIGSENDGQYGLHFDKFNITHWRIWGNSPP